MSQKVQGFMFFLDCSRFRESMETGMILLGKTNTPPPVAAR